MDEAAVRRSEVPLDPAVRTGRSAEGLVAAAACLAVGGRFTLQQGLTVGILISVALAPVWLRPLWRMRGGPTILVLGALAPISGALLAWVFAVNHDHNISNAQQEVLLLVGLIGGIGVLTWARTVLGDAATASWFGIGLILALAQRGLDFDNVWKFSLSIPIVVTSLALALFARWRTLDLGVLALLATVAILNDSRSNAAMLVIAMMIIVWQRFLQRYSRRSTPTTTWVSMLLVSIVGYFVMQSLILQGFFGRETMVRSEVQIETAGNLILGGRPEMGAAFALLSRNPLGFGVGITPNPTDILIAKNGMAQLDYAPNNGYVDQYMFGSGFEVHSMLGDLWLRFGIPGCLLAVALLFIVLRGTTYRMADRMAGGLIIYLMLQVVWDMFFTPFFFSTISTLMLAVALCLVPRRRPPIPGADDALSSALAEDRVAVAAPALP
jgi:hypothetical protein